MTDPDCLLAGLVRLFSPVLLLVLWRKKTNASVFPALIAWIMCFPAFIIAGLIRSGFDQNNMLSFFIKQGFLYGIFEEGTKFLTLRYLLSKYDSPRDSVSYGIGHGALEEFGAGMACLNLIGTDRAASDILIVNILAAAIGSATVIGLTVIIFYGIQTERSKLTLPAAMILHAVGNMTSAISLYGSPVITALSLIPDIVIYFIAYRCWKAMR